MEIYSHPDIPEILSLPGNSNCCDCNAEKPKWASLNNGVFLCLKCAGIHRSLGSEITLIRSLQIDSWTDNQILYLSKGGNNKFKQNLSEYNIPPNLQIDLKYKSKAADYYRKLLKNEVEKIANKKYYKETEIIKPKLEEGKEIIELKKDHKVNNLNLNKNVNEEKKEEGFLGVFSSFLNNVKKTAGDVAGKITKEIDELKIGEKIKGAGDTVVDYAIAGGNFIKNKSEQAINSDFVQGITKTAESGFNTVVEKTKLLLNKDNNQQQNINPNLLENNESEAKKNEDVEMSDIIDNNNNNVNNLNDINNINNINKLDNVNNNNNDNAIPNKENKNEDIQKKEEIISEEKQKEENKSDKVDEKQKEDNKLDKIEEKQKEENKIEIGANDNSNNAIDNKIVKEESVEHVQEKPENP